MANSEQSASAELRSLLARLVIEGQHSRAIAMGQFRPCTKARKPRKTPRQLAEWDHISRDLVIPAQKRFASKYDPILSAYRAALRRSKRSRKRPGLSPFLRRASREMKPIYRGILEAAIEDTVRSRSKASKRRSRSKPRTVRFDSGPYKYGRLDSAGNVKLDVDAMVRDRLKHLDDSIRNIDKELAARIERGGGWGAEQIDELLDDFEERLQTIGNSVKSNEAWASTNTGRIGGMVQSEVEEMEWLTAGDEDVRDTHVLYGSVGPKPLGFNYASLHTGKWMIRWPYDEECTELCDIINCRCIPV